MAGLFCQQDRMLKFLSPYCFFVISHEASNYYDDVLLIFQAKYIKSEWRLAKQGLCPPRPPLRLGTSLGRCPFAHLSLSLLYSFHFIETHRTNIIQRDHTARELRCLPSPVLSGPPEERTCCLTSSPPRGGITYIYIESRDQRTPSLDHLLG